MRKRVCIFCGANTGTSEKIVEQSKELAQLLIANDFDLVYGGGSSGLMGIMADEFLAAKHNVIGIRPKGLISEATHQGITEMIVSEDMFSRKSTLMEISDLFIALPGGIGTLDEILDVYTNLKIGFIDKYCGVLSTDNYYEGLSILLSNMVNFEFLKNSDKLKLHIAKSPLELMDGVLAWNR